MLGSILGGGAGCIVTPESHFKQTIPVAISPRWVEGISRDTLLQALEKNFRFKIWRSPLPVCEGLPQTLMPPDYGRLIMALVDEYAKKQEVGSWNTWVDHTPQNIQNPLVLLQIFPEAKFVHLVRDPRAVATSVLPLDWGPYNADEAALFWAQKLSYGLALEQSYPERVMRVYYEDIVRTPEETIRRVCAHCGIEFSSAMLDGSAFAVPDYTRAQHRLVGSRPDPKRLDSRKQKLDVWQVATIEKSVGDLMVMMGYALSHPVLPTIRPWRQRLALRFAPLFSYLKKRRFQRKKKHYA